MAIQSDMKNVLKRILLHALEFAIVLFAALALFQFFGGDITNESRAIVIATVLAAFAKLGRELYGDFVNNPVK